MPTCSVCHATVDQELCAICSDPSRDIAALCIVADTDCLIAIERTGSYRGLYHVLGGVISPLEGIGPDQLRVRELIQRLDRDQVKEVILATNPQVEVEATARYIQWLLKPFELQVSRYGRRDNSWQGSLLPRRRTIPRLWNRSLDMLPRARIWLMTQIHRLGGSAESDGGKPPDTKR